MRPLQGIGSWWHVWEGRGDLATWLAGLATILTLAVALYLVGRDRRERIRQQARQIAVLQSQESDGVLTVTLVNLSDQLVTDPQVQARPPDDFYPLTLDGDVKPHSRSTVAVLPGERAWLDLDYMKVSIVVTFRDQMGRLWRLRAWPGHSLRLRRETPWWVESARYWLTGLRYRARAWLTRDPMRHRH